MLIVFFSLLSGASYGQERQGKPRIEAMTGLNVEVSASNNRDIVNVGLWMAADGIVTHAGVFDIKPKNESGLYGADIGMGYCFSGYRLWPFAELGLKVGAGAGLSSFSAELYPKIGLAVPLSDQVLIYVAYLYSFSTKGNSDYSAASVGFVWAVL